MTYLEQWNYNLIYLTFMVATMEPAVKAWELIVKTWGGNAFPLFC